MLNFSTNTSREHVEDFTPSHKKFENRKISIEIFGFQNLNGAGFVYSIRFFSCSYVSTIVCGVFNSFLFLNSSNALRNPFANGLM